MLTNSDVFKPQDIELVIKIYDMGGQATASQLAKIDDKHPSAYNAPVVALAKRVHYHTNCTFQNAAVVTKDGGIYLFMADI